MNKIRKGDEVIVITGRDKGKTGRVLQVNRETGCMIVVRPDQYVSHVLPLDGHEALTDFFAGILIEAEDT